ncbi:MAG: hypothetical protein QXT43_02070 [Candidatus Micrarchaeaceae archaeon]
MQSLIEEPYQRTGFSTIEKEAVMKVRREMLQEELAASGAQKAKSTLLNVSEHAKAIAKIIGTADYEAICAHRLVHNIKRMSAKEQQEYLNAIESFAKACDLAYANKKMLLLMLYGIVYTATSAEAVSQYTQELHAILRQRRERLLKKAAAEAEKLQNARRELESNSGIFARLFKRKKTRNLERRLNARSARVSKLEKSIERYEEKARSAGIALYK